MVKSAKQRPNARQLFIQGFWKGAAAPCLLDAVHVLPSIPAVPQVSAPSGSINKALASDWLRIGHDLRTVIDNYGKEASASDATDNLA
jgi:hypothetical protein